MSDPLIAKTRIVKKDGEFVVRAYGEKNQRLPNSDYYTDSREDAEETAKMMAKEYNLSKTKNIPLTKELKERLVRAAQQQWEYVALDYLQLFENNECSAEDAHECVADRMEDEDWNKLSR